MSVKGKVTVITAAASGIGKATALQFAREGSKLAICDIDEKSLEATRKELSTLTDVIAVKCNMAEISEIDLFFEKVIAKYGTIDILINNAGIAGPTKPITEVEPEEWDLTLNVNLRGGYYCIKKAAPFMIKKNFGKIVNISSMSGKRPLLNRAPYCASKMGVIGMTRTVADELGKYNITVNAVCPGAISGSRLDLVLENMARVEGKTIEQVKDTFLEPSMLKRTIPPEDIAKMVLFLSDEEKSNSITGQDINVNCGVIFD